MMWAMRRVHWWRRDRRTCATSSGAAATPHTSRPSPPRFLALLLSPATHLVWSARHVRAGGPVPPTRHPDPQGRLATAQRIARQRTEPAGYSGATLRCAATLAPSE